MTNNRIAVGSVVEGISGAGYVRTDADGLVLDPGDSPSIATADIAAGAVTTPKLADDAVTTAKITNLAVTDAKISSLAFSKLTSLPTALTGYGIADSQAATGAWTLAGSLALSAGSGGTTVFTTAITGESASRFILKANGSMYLTNGTATDSVRERKSGGGFYEYRTTAADNPGTGNIIEYLGNGGSGMKFAITEDGKTYLTATGSTSAQHYLTNGAVEGSIYASSSIGGLVVGSVTNYPLYFMQNSAIVGSFQGGRMIVGTGTDDGSNKLQVSGSMISEGVNSKSLTTSAVIVCDSFTGFEARTVFRENGGNRWELTKGSANDLYLFNYSTLAVVAKFMYSTGYLALGGNDATHWLDVPSMRIRTGSAPTAADGAIYFDGTNLRLYSGGAWRTITQI